MSDQYNPNIYTPGERACFNCFVVTTILFGFAGSGTIGYFMALGFNANPWVGAGVGVGLTCAAGVSGGIYGHQELKRIQSDYTTPSNTA